MKVNVFMHIPFQLKAFNNSLFVTSSLDHSLTVWDFEDTQAKCSLKGMFNSFDIVFEMFHRYCVFINQSLLLNCDMTM